jgi:hypothetical protein
MDFGETVPPVCSGTYLTVFADAREVSDIKVEDVLATQELEEDPLAIALPAVKAADMVCYKCMLCM